MAIYHDMLDVYPWLLDLPRQYPDIAEHIVVGKSLLGRDIVAIKISTDKGAKKPALWPVFLRPAFPAFAAFAAFAETLVKTMAHSVSSF